MMDRHYPFKLALAPRQCQARNLFRPNISLASFRRAIHSFGYYLARLLAGPEHGHGLTSPSGQVALTP
jgi:hypothetical protein